MPFSLVFQIVQIEVFSLSRMLQLESCQKIENLITSHPFWHHIHHHALFAVSILVSWSFLQLTKNQLASEHLPTLPLIFRMDYHYMLKKQAQLKFLNQD
ncbi:hypothetical protein LDENG_00087490 [Lucifuga dentata]|nr:hypothetical protein LDENG_00087490 [Lucifuga dentata]